MKTSQKYLVVVAVVCGLIFGSPARAALVLQFDSTNYVAGTWTDTSGNANNATQGTGGLQPALVSGATPGGKPALQFDGTDDLLSLTTGLSSPAFTTSPTLTFVTVVKNQRDETTYESVFIGGSGTASFTMISGSGFGPPGKGRLVLAKGGVAIAAYSEYVDRNQWMIYAGTYDGSSYRFYTNGVQVVTDLSSGWTATGPVTTVGSLGGGGFLQGQMAALYVYDTALDATALGNISSQLYATYLAEAPEPSVALLLGMGGLLAWRRRRG